jgi:hypothetical protein
MTENTTIFEGWAILELMGHRRLAGYVREQEVAGQGFIRIDVPARDGKKLVATQFYSPGSIYCMTPTTEQIARRVAASSQPEPVHHWELPEPGRGPAPQRVEDDDLLKDDGLPL